jgi:hypothetical protein
MKITDLYKILPIAIKNKKPVLLKSSPGMGKSDVIKDIVENVLGYEFMILHPVVSNPIDFKGLPVSGTINNELVADFIPYGDLRKMMEAKNNLVVVLEDLGQSSVACQSAVMQIILAREINGKKISDKVSFVAATNDKTDNAGVTGLITPMLSRFTGGIFKLDIDSDAWIDWAIKNNMPLELISYIKAKPSMLSTFDPKNKNIENFACPRTIAGLGEWINNDVINHEVFSAVVGEIFATEFMAYYKICKSIATLPAEIIKNPKGADIPSKPDVLYFVLTALANKTKEEKIFCAVLDYFARLPKEYESFAVKIICTKNPKMKETSCYINWHVKNQDVVV